MSVTYEIVTEGVNQSLIPLSVVVKVKESDDRFWKEAAELVSVSSGGAGFYLQRECQIGRLVSLLLELPPHQRSYDHDKELYRVWGLVQHCYMISSEEATVYHVGVAFIGKYPPATYRQDPTQSYRINGMKEDGLWRIKEAASPFKTRKHVRYWKAIDLYLAVVNSRKEAGAGEKAVTENISQSGAAVISTLDVNVGDRVKFISEEYDFSGLAVVCNRKTGEDGRQRLHLEFVENTFPIEEISLPPHDEFKQYEN